MPVFYDQLNRPVNIPSLPKRIISVVPSQTELLFSLGLADEVVGITKFCIHPAHQYSIKTKVGGTKQLNIEVIKSLQPNLIIANKEENEQSQVEELAQYFPVWISDINTLAGALDMIKKVGELVNRVHEAAEIATGITHHFNLIDIPNTQLKAAYLIWRQPYMAAGTNTFIDSMMQYCGLTNALNATRYPKITAGELAAAKPDVVLLSSEPYPFKQKHIDEIKAIVPEAEVVLVDGEMFSWYGSRLLYAPDYFRELQQVLV